MSSNIRKLVLCWLFFYAVFSVQAYIRPYNERNVFQSDSSYCYRIPSMVRTNNGTLVAVAEGRETDCGDYGDVDIVVRRSTDNGNTWGNTILIDSFGSSRLHNPCPVVDQRTNRVYVFYCADANVIAYKYSNDNGNIWSNYAEIESYPDDIDLTGYLNGNAGTGYADGIYTGSISPEDSAFLGVNTNGEMAEVLVYNRALSGTEQNKVGYYLENKYDLDTAYIPEPATIALMSMGI